MITDEQADILFKALDEGKTLAEAARRAQVSYNTARKYRSLNTYPGKMKGITTRERQRLFDDEWEQRVVPFLGENPGASAQEVLTHLIDLKPKVYSQSMLRTLERRLKAYKLETPSLQITDSIAHKDVEDLCVTSLIKPRTEIYVRGHQFRHLLFLYYNPFHRWIHLAPVTEATYGEVLEFMEEAFWISGLIPKRHFHYQINEYEQMSGLPLAEWEGMKRFMAYYGMEWVHKPGAKPPKYQEAVNTIFREFSDALEENDDSLKFSTEPGYKLWLDGFSRRFNEKYSGSIKYDVAVKTRRTPPGQGIVEQLRKEDFWIDPKAHFLIPLI